MTEHDDYMSSLHETLRQIERTQQTKKIVKSAEPGDLFRCQNDCNDLDCLIIIIAEKHLILPMCDISVVGIPLYKKQILQIADLSLLFDINLMKLSES